MFTKYTVQRKTRRQNNAASKFLRSFHAAVYTQTTLSRTYEHDNIPAYGVVVANI